MAFLQRNRNVHFEGSFEAKKWENRQPSIIVVKRLKILLISCLVFTLVLVFRVGYIQYGESEKLTTALNKYGSTVFTSSTPRGNIVDRNYTILATNTNSICVTYYAIEGITSAEIETTATFLAKNLETNLDNISLRNKKDYFIMAYPDVADNLITKSERERLSKQQNATKAIYNLKLERITEELINKYMSHDEIEQTRFKYLIQSCVSGSVVLAEDLTIEQASLIGSNSSLIRGITITTDWNRTYATDSVFAQVLGKVTTKKQGLPSELKTKLLALDYPNDAKVGTSGLEKQYENILKGEETQYKIVYDNDGNPTIKSVKDGEQGANIRISIDWELQQLADNLITTELQKVNSRNKYFNRMFLTLINPNNGEIIVMSGKTINKETGEVSDYAAGNYLDANKIGSTIKGGIVYTAFKENVISANTCLVDEPLYFSKAKGVKPKKSWKNMGNINEVDALAYSSNVYMFKIAMMIGGTTYVPYNKLNVKAGSLAKIRNGLGELGLGIKTGVDLPNETVGYIGADTTSGTYLDAAIGQYDTYTNLQLATYAATLANMGKKIKPHLFLESYVTDEENKNISLYKNNTNIVGDVSEQVVAFQQIRKGMRACVTRNDGTCHAYWSSKPYVTYAKTGTAEHYDANSSTDYPNHLQIGYISATEGSTPILAFACITYRQTIASTGEGSSAPYISQAVIDKYVEKYGLTVRK